MTEGRIEHLCTSAKKGVCKTEVESVRLLPGHGIEGDAHAGDWHRQVSLLDSADIESMRAQGLDLAPGAFGENIVVSGLDLVPLGVGSRITAGESELEITQIGKECHTRCAIYYRTGDCIMPRAGVFARVLAGGRLTAGTPLKVIRRIPRRRAG